MAEEEIVFEVSEEGTDGGYVARALNHSIYTQGDNWSDLRSMVKDAVACHFAEPNTRPKNIRLHFVRGRSALFMKFPRNCTGPDLVRALRRFGYRVSRQAVLTSSCQLTLRVNIT